MKKGCGRVRTERQKKTENRNFTEEKYRYYNLVLSDFQSIINHVLGQYTIDQTIFTEGILLGCSILVA